MKLFCVFMCDVINMSSCDVIITMRPYNNLYTHIVVQITLFYIYRNLTEFTNMYVGFFIHNYYDNQM